jgi:hypothetical protein
MYAELEPTDPGGRCITVYDLQLVSFKSLLGSTFALAKEVISNFQQHYPERTDKVFILNAPAFFSTLWHLLTPILDPRTTAKVSISSSDRTEILEYVGASSVPKIYGGTDTTPFGEAVEELQFREYFQKTIGALLAATDPMERAATPKREVDDAPSPFGSVESHSAILAPPVIHEADSVESEGEKSFRLSMIFLAALIALFAGAAKALTFN